MRVRSVVISTIAAMVLAGCGSDTGTTDVLPPPPPPPPPPSVLLKEIQVPSLPSPYYHFEYDASGRVKIASFASDFTIYAITYAGGRIKDLTNTTLGNRDRLDYVYDDLGRVKLVKYVKPDQSISTLVQLTYDGQKLTGLSRQRTLAGVFVMDKT